MPRCSGLISAFGPPLALGHSGHPNTAHGTDLLEAYPHWRLAKPISQAVRTGRHGVLDSLSWRLLLLQAGGHGCRGPGWLVPSLRTWPRAWLLSGLVAFLRGCYCLFLLACSTTTPGVCLCFLSGLAGFVHPSGTGGPTVFCGLLPAGFRSLQLSGQILRLVLDTCLYGFPMSRLQSCKA